MRIYQKLQSGLILFVTMVLPMTAHAYVKIANCDNKPYDVIVTNAGTQHVVSLPPMGGPFEEEGDSLMITLQIRDPQGHQPIIKPNSPGEEYCIWGGRILVQKIDTTNNPGSHSGWR